MLSSMLSSPMLASPMLKGSKTKTTYNEEKKADNKETTKHINTSSTIQGLSLHGYHERGNRRDA